MMMMMMTMMMMMMMMLMMMMMMIMMIFMLYIYQLFSVLGKERHCSVAPAIQSKPNIENHMFSMTLYIYIYKISSISSDSSTPSTRPRRG